MELCVYIERSNDHRYLLRLVNEFSPLLSDIYKDFIMCASYKNITRETFNKIIYDQRLQSSDSLICTCEFDIIDKVISEYIEKTTKYQEPCHGQDVPSSEEISPCGQVYLSKSTIDDIKKCHKECEHILKSCIYEQLGKLFIKEKIDDIYDKIPNKDVDQVNILDDYMHAIYKNKEFDLHACARKHAEILIKAFHNIIVEYVNSAF